MFKLTKEIHYYILEDAKIENNEDCQKITSIYTEKSSDLLFENLIYFPNLETLIWVDTKINYLPTYGKLQHLYLYGCNIQELPNNMPNLKVLTCDVCKELTKLPKELSNLEILNINFTGITNIDICSPKLKIIRCVGSNLEMPIKYYPNLQELVCFTNLSNLANCIHAKIYVPTEFDDIYGDNSKFLLNKDDIKIYFK